MARGATATSIVGTLLLTTALGHAAPPVAPPGRNAAGPDAIAASFAETDRAAPTRDTSSSWAARAAERWTARGRALEQRGEVPRALVAYTEALRSDPTFGPAYLGLGRLRERLADYAEAERIYARAIHLPSVAAEALARRASIRRARGDRAGALLDLEAAVRQPGRVGPDHLELLARWYIERRNWLAALMLYRRMAGELDDSDPRFAEVRLKVRALTVLAADLDPVIIGSDHPNWIRRSLASIASP